MNQNGESEAVEVVERTVASDTVRASWNWSLDTIRQDTKHYPTEVQETLIGLFRWCIDDRHPMRRSDVAARLGCSQNLLYQIFKGIYRDPDKSLRIPSADLMKRIKEFMALEQQRFESGKTEFVETPTSKRVSLACDLSRESQTPVILWGPSHIGKTWAFRHYQQHNNHGRTFMAELDAASGLGGVVRCVASACGISDKSNTAALVERIKRALTPNTVLIVDEVHLLHYTYRKSSFFACIDTLRRIYDHCHCGMVLSWTNIEDLKAASQTELIQIWNRGVHKMALPKMPTIADLGCLIFPTGLPGDPVRDENGKIVPNCVFPSRDLRVTLPAKHGPITESPREIIRQVCKHGLLGVTERLRYARKLAAKSRENKISWSFFVDAHLRIEKQSIQEGEWS